MYNNADSVTHNDTAVCLSLKHWHRLHFCHHRKAKCNRVRSLGPWSLGPRSSGPRFSGYSLPVLCPLPVIKSRLNTDQSFLQPWISFCKFIFKLFLPKLPKSFCFMFQSTLKQQCTCRSVCIDFSAVASFPALLCNPEGLGNCTEVQGSKIKCK